MLALVVAHLAAGVAAPGLVRLLGRRAFPVIALVPLAAFVWTVTATGEVADGGVRTQAVSWVPVLDLDLAFAMGALQWVLALVWAAAEAGRRNAPLVVVYAANYPGMTLEPGPGLLDPALVRWRRPTRSSSAASPRRWSSDRTSPSPGRPR